ncbi:hypothetical protein [Halobacterium litoreum]|uniref:Copper resistance protein D n=1 Tax=Halobacterium litoreum TaxID=2039234 RepID=A0ABD5NAX8_9EURY|nr:hypothetical protein [Halobacterium litoreum]UHH14757.1 hypothetical protein LT972_07070 [Halobacterium litoreum]
MALPETLAYVIHILFAGLVTGSVLFAAWTLPAVQGSLSSSARETFVSRLRMVSRSSALLLFATGGYMLSAFDYVPGDRLTGTGDGHLVLAMFVLWLAMTGVVEAASSKLADGEDASTLLYVAAGLAALVLADAGVLAAGGF